MLINLTIKSSVIVNSDGSKISQTGGGETAKGRGD